MFDLERKPYARRYDLGYEDGFLALRMSKLVAEMAHTRLLLSSDRLEDAQTAFAEAGFAIGEFGFESSIGFGGVLIEREKDGEVGWELDLPSIRPDDHTPLIAVSATLHFVFQAMMHLEGVEDERPQLLAVDVHATPGHYPIGARLSGAMAAWCASGIGTGHTLPEVEAVMRDAWSIMWPREAVGGFHAMLDAGGRIILGCPGQATGLGPLHGRMVPGEGYALDCHNVDGALQQLALLAGLARLNQLARRGLG